jgi:hypothetical protein
VVPELLKALALALGAQAMSKVERKAWIDAVKGAQRLKAVPQARPLADHVLRNFPKA